MARSQNGWPASPTMATRPLVVEGVEFIGGIVDNEDVETVLRYVMENYHHRVEPLRNPGCWGGYFRPNRNDPDSLSNHASRTALDANAPAHPNGVPTRETFTAAQVDEVHVILAEVDHVVRWGGDYHGTPDAMHFEINDDAAAVARVAARLREDEFVNEDTLRRIVAEEIETALNKPRIDVGKGRKWSIPTVLSNLRTLAKGGQ